MALTSSNFLKVAIPILTLLPFHDLQKLRKVKTRLVHTQVILRHGERTPPIYCDKTDTSQWKKSFTERLPTVPLPPFQYRTETGQVVEDGEEGDNDEEKYLPGGAKMFGLTQRGMKECFKVGKALRQQYKNKLPLDDKVFQENQTELFTSNYQRAKISLAYAMAGVFPNYVGEKKLTFNLFDSLLTRDHLKDSPTWRNWRKFCDDHRYELVQGYQESTAIIASFCNITEEPPFWLLSGVTDGMTAWKANGLDEDQSQPENKYATGLLPLLPDLNVKSNKLHLAKYIGDSRFGILLANLTAKPLLTNIISNMRRYIAGDGKQMIIYSGHDVTMLPLMDVLGMPPGTTLPLGATLAFELYQEVLGSPNATGRYYARTVFQGIEEKESKMLSWGKFQRKMNLTLDDLGINGCENATFTMRDINKTEDSGNPRCHEEKCVDVECPGEDTV